MTCSLLTALSIAERAHAGQMRADGAPFIDHPVAVVGLLFQASVDLPLEAYVAAALHDVVEDTAVTADELRLVAGADVTEAVLLLTRVEAPTLDRRAAEEAYLRRMVIDAHAYPYVPLIKLADRIHNMETAAALSPEKCDALIEETSDLYLPFFTAYAPDVGRFATAYRWLLRRLRRAVKTQSAVFDGERACVLHRPSAFPETSAGRQDDIVPASCFAMA